MAKVLLFNISADKLAKLRFILLRNGIGCRLVSPAEQSQSIGCLAGIDAFPPSPAEGVTAFDDEMLVMCGFSDPQVNTLLAAMRANRLSIPLKAVLTETNSLWNASALHEELVKEHAAMKLASGSSIHNN